MKLSTKNQNGITLVALAITVALLITLATVSIYSGVGIVSSSKLTTFTEQMKIMQTEINNLYEKSKTGEDVNIYGTPLENTDAQIQKHAKSVFTLSASGVTDSTGYKYFTESTLKQLGIEGVQGEFFVNIQKRSVISYDGFPYKGRVYYTVSQLPNGLYNIDYEALDTNGPTFSATSKQVDSEYEITIDKTSINYSGNVKKWQVKYKLEGQSYWSVSEDLTFKVNAKGTYYLKLSNGDIETSDENQVKLVI